MNVTKAIIPVAGWGTRMLPITKAIEKCMLPVGTRPVIDYVVQDMVAAGIKDIYFVVGEQSSQIENYYRSNIQLNDYLRKKGKDDMLDKVAPHFENEVDNAVDGLTSMMEPLIMAILGVLVGGLVIAMYLPIFQMGSVV